MELSKGFNNLDLKTNKTHSKKYSVIIPKDIAERINLEIFDSKGGAGIAQSENNVIIILNILYSPIVTIFSVNN